MDARGIRRTSHQAIQRVDLANQMTLSNAADCGVAAHLTDRPRIMSQKQRPRPATRRGGRGFAAGMPAPHDDYIERTVIHRPRYRRLLPNAELRKHPVENAFGIHRAGQAPQGTQRGPQALSSQFRKGRELGAFQSLDGLT